MRNLLRIATLVFVLVWDSGVCAYELATHARMTYFGFIQSQLNQSSAKRGSLGLPKGSYTDLGNVYYDMDATALRDREAKDYDWDNFKFPKIPGIDPDVLTNIVPGWLMRGAVREDDPSYSAWVASSLRHLEPRPPFDDPYGEFNRFCNHFFDPYHNQSLNGFVGESLCLGDILASAPVWALGTYGPFTAPANAGSNRYRRNHFTVYDAREAMWRALTLTTLVDGWRLYPLTGDGDDAKARETSRKAYWATTFRALGDVVHIVQDMAQPAHTRNEVHAAGAWGLFESYLNRRAIGFVDKEITIDGEVIERWSPLQNPDYMGYPTPRFAHYSDYWSTGTGAASLSGQGLADYSSRGFFTLGKSIGNTDFPLPSPSPDPRTYALVQVSDVNKVVREYLDGQVSDTLNPGRETIHMVRKGLWFDALATVQGDPVAHAQTVYTLDRAVYDDQAKLLIPRGVAYSAGVLDYFFRGSMEVSMTDLNAYAIVDHGQFGPKGMYYPTNAALGFKGFDKIRLMLKNTTPPIALADGSTVAQPMNGGRLAAVVKFHRNLCYKDDLSGELTDIAQLATCRSPVEEIVTSDAVMDASGNPIGGPISVPFEADSGPGGVEFQFKFSVKQIPINAWDVILQVVYRGQLGSEDDAVVVTTKDISEPTYIQMFDDMDCNIKDPPGTECKSDYPPHWVTPYYWDLYIKPKFPIWWKHYGIVLSVGWPSEPARSDEAFFGRIIRVAGLFDVDRLVEIKGYTSSHNPPNPDEDYTFTFSYIPPSRVQLAVGDICPDYARVLPERFRGTPVADVEGTMNWSDAGKTNAYWASRWPPTYNYASPIKILNW